LLSKATARYQQDYCWSSADGMVYLFDRQADSIFTPLSGSLYIVVCNEWRSAVENPKFTKSFFAFLPVILLLH